MRVIGAKPSYKIETNYLRLVLIIAFDHEMFAVIRLNEDRFRTESGL